MTTDDLIAKLMELDPEGNKGVYISIPYVTIPINEIYIDSDGDIVFNTANY